MKEEFFLLRPLFFIATAVFMTAIVVQTGIQAFHERALVEKMLRDAAEHHRQNHPAPGTSGCQPVLSPRTSGHDT